MANKQGYQKKKRQNYRKTYLVSFADLRVFSRALYMPNIIHAN